MGNGEAKELICMTHGHEIRWRKGGEGDKGEKKWEDCNSIINKIYIKKEILEHTHNCLNTGK